MGYIEPSRVRDTSQTTGTGAYTLDGDPPQSCFSFGSALATGDSCDYVAVMGGDVEIGRGTMQSDGTLARTAIYRSSNGDEAVDWPDGVKDIFAARAGFTDMDSTGLANFVALLVPNALSDIVDDTTPQLGGNLDAQSHKITGLAAGTANGDALRYEQVVGVYLPLAGGTMAGDVAMGSHKLTGLAAGSANGHSVRYEQVIGVYLPLAGGTMAGNVAFGGSYKLTGLAAGTTSGDSVRYEQVVGVYCPIAGGVQLTGSFTLAIDDDGTKSSGTYTPSVAAGSNAKKIAANGAFAFAPPAPASGEYIELVVFVINGASAGAITTSGFTWTDGDPFTTTNNHKFMCTVRAYNLSGTVYSLLLVKAMQ